MRNRYFFFPFFAFLITINTVLTQSNFITKWTYSSGTTSVQFNALTNISGVNYSYTLSSGGSGSGSFMQTTGGNVILPITIPSGASVTISMEPNNLQRFYMNSGTHSDNLIDVMQWGSAPWMSMDNAFNGCSNLQITATDVPNLSFTTSASNMFSNCTILNSPLNINSWNTSQITNMSGMFNGATSFNQNIDAWDITSVSDMSYMFYGASSYNQILNDNLNANVNLTNIFSNSGLSCIAYSQMLLAWASNPATPSNRTLGATNVFFGSNASVSRSFLINSKGWTITDGGLSGAVCQSCTIPSSPILISESSGATNDDGTICLGASATLTASGGSSYAWSTGATTASINLSPSTTTLYTVTVTNANGCTANASQTLTVNSLPTATIDITETSGFVNNDGIVCSGDSIMLIPSSATANGYVWSEGESSATIQLNPTQTTTYTVYFYDSNNCENYQDVTITVNELPTITISVAESSGLTNNDGIVCIGDAVYLTANGGTFHTWSTHETSSSIYLNPTSTSTISVIARDINGCLNIDSVSINVNPLPAPSNQNVVLCFGETLTVGSNTYNTSGSYIDTFIGINGCDSVVTTNLTIQPFVSSNQTLVLCVGESYAVGTSTYTTSGTYADVLTSIDGCDSTVYTDLTILPANAFFQNITLCNDENYAIGDSVYTSSGTYTNVLTAQYGCDSTVTTNLTILNPNTASQNIVLCFGDSYTIGDSTYTMAGVYTNVLTSSMGCDSTITTTITVNAPVNVATTVSEITIIAIADNASYLWMNCANNQAISGETNQSYTATANGEYGVIVTQNNCSDTSACVTIDNVGLEENEWIVKLFPNPATEEINIETTEIMKFIRIFDFSDKLVAEKEVKSNATSFTVENIIKGIYFLQVNTSNASKIIRFVKE